MEQVRDKTFYTTVAEQLAPSHTGLLMYDPTDSLLADESIAANAPDLVSTWRRLLEAARTIGIPVVYARTAHDLSVMTPPWLRHLSRTRPPGFVDRLVGAGVVIDGDFADGLEPLDGEQVLDHTYYDLFTGTDLAPLLRQREVETVALTGLVTESGIWATARRAAAEGFYAVIVEDCVASPRWQMHLDALAHLRQHFDVVTSDEVLRIWREEASR